MAFLIVWSSNNIYAILIVEFESESGGITTTEQSLYKKGLVLPSRRLVALECETTPKWWKWVVKCEIV